MNNRILIAEDERDIIEILRVYLEAEGYEILTASNGYEALQLARQHTVLVMIVDIMMPEMNGLELIQKVRTFSSVPIIVLSARILLEDRIKGMEVGADAYLTKPFEPSEVVTYVKALSKRYQERETGEGEILKVKDLKMDPVNFGFWRGEEAISLTSMEWKIMYTMMSHPDKIFTKGQLVKAVGDEWYDKGANSIMVHISRLRNKLERDSSDPKYIITVRGVGYRLAT